MNGYTLVAAKAALGTAALGASLALGFLSSPASVAHAAPAGVDVYAYESTVNLSELPTIDWMPVCTLEDGSDIDSALLPCVWTDPDTGNDYLTFDDRSFLIVDDTVDVAHDAAAYESDTGAYVGGYN